MTELKRCPFCGEEIYYYFPFAGADFDGHCRNKNCFMYGVEITFGDVAKYNTRPIEDELEARIAQLTAENERLQNDVNDYKGDIRYFKKTKDSQTETIDKLTAERDELKLAVAQTELDISAWKNICTEWYKDAERLIQLANFNNARAGEYFDLHEQLVKKYEEPPCQE